jgi:hypothetical protein
LGHHHKVVSKAAKLDLTEDEAGALFDDLDVDGSGSLAPQKIRSLGGSLKNVWNRFRKK